MLSPGSSQANTSRPSPGTASQTRNAPGIMAADTAAIRSARTGPGIKPWCHDLTDAVGGVVRRHDAERRHERGDRRRRPGRRAR